MKPRRGTHRRSRVPEASNPWRDQEATAFTSILGALVAGVPGAKAAAMVDSEGETVDYAGRGDPFRLRVTAAHWRIVLQHASHQKSLQGLQWLAMRGARCSYVVYVLPHGYALVLALTRVPGLARWQRAVAACAGALGQEAGWALAEEKLSAATGAVWRATSHRAGEPGWFRVEIIADERRRPRAVRIGDRLHALEILGTIVWHKEGGDGLNAHRAAPKSVRGERAWRVRFEKGIEATIVREPGGAWYADEPVDILVRPG